MTVSESNWYQYVRIKAIPGKLLLMISLNDAYREPEPSVQGQGPNIGAVFKESP